MESSPSRALVEGYALEIVARLHAAQRRCRDLLGHQYVSRSPPVLARTLERVCRFLSLAVIGIVRDIKWDDGGDSLADDLQLLRTADDTVRELYAQLRYVESAQTAKLPWSTSRPSSH